MEIVIGLWVVMAALVAAVAQGSGRDGGTAFVLCVVLSPVLGALVTCLLPVKATRTRAGRAQVSREQAARRAEQAHRSARLDPLYQWEMEEHRRREEEGRAEAEGENRP